MDSSSARRRHRLVETSGGERGRVRGQAGGGVGCGGCGDAGPAGSILVGVLLLAGCRRRARRRSQTQSRRFRASPSRSGPSMTPPSWRAWRRSAASGRHRAAAQITIRDEPVTLESLSSVDVLLFPAQRLGDLVDAGVLAPIPNAAVLPPKPAEIEARRPEPPGKPARQGRAGRHLSVHGHRAGLSRAGQPLRHRAARLAVRRLGAGAGLSPRCVRERRQPRGGAAGGADAGSRPRPGRSSTPWPGSSRAATGTATAQPDHGIALALGADAEGVGNATFLARAASLGQHRDQYSFLFDSDDMTPRIDTPPFVEALARSDRTGRHAGPPGMERFDAAAAREAFRTGKVALLIDRAERAAAWSHGKPVGVAPLPGSDRVFEPIRKEWTPPSPRNAPSYLPQGGGWLVGINGRLSGTQLEAAIDFAKYLANPENSNRIRAERTFPMLPVRTSQMGQGLPDPTSAPDVDSRLWSDAVSRTLLAERVVPGLRIPGADGYLTDLAKGRVAAAGGEAPEKALAAVAKAWTERTKATGPSVSSGIIVAASTAWPRSRSLRNPENKRAQPWTRPTSRCRP